MKLDVDCKGARGRGRWMQRNGARIHNSAVDLDLRCCSSEFDVDDDECERMDVDGQLAGCD